MTELKALGKLDMAWAKYHNAWKACQATTPGTASHRKALEKADIASAELNDIRADLGAVGGSVERVKRKAKATSRRKATMSERLLRGDFSGG